MKIDLAYNYIKELIINGNWDEESMLNVNEITEQLRMSRTPVYKAMTRLEQEGFLTIAPQSGVYVKKPVYEEVLERLLVCANLDALIAETAAGKITDQQLEEMAALLHQMEMSDLSNERYAELNKQFHGVIYEASGMNYMHDLIEQLWSYLEYVGRPDYLFDEEMRKRSSAEHRVIYYSLKERDGDMVKKMTERHMARVAHIISSKYLE